MGETGDVSPPCSPAWEFDHVVTHVLANLPQVDAFRFRRVCRCFDRLLRTRLDSVVLHCYGLQLQMRERGLASLGFGDVVAQILGVYGRGLVKLEIKFPNNYCISDNEFVNLKIATECPNLVCLCLKSFAEDCDRRIPVFSASNLLLMPKLQTLDARLTLEFGGAGRERAIVKRIRQLEKLSTMDLVPGELREIVRCCPVVLDCVDGIRFDVDDPPKFGDFPQVRQLTVFCNRANCRFPREECFYASCLTKLELVFSDKMSNAEVLFYLKFFVHITEFRIRQDCLGIEDVIPNYLFLTSFSKLRILAVTFVENFTPNYFMLIPETAPLTEIELNGCPANCAQVYRFMIDRKYRLSTLKLIGLTKDGDRDAVMELVEFNQDTLDRLELGGSIVDDQFLDRLPSGFLIKPAFLYLETTDITAEGVRGLLRRRKELLAGIRGVGDRVSTGCSEVDGCDRLLIIVLMSMKIFIELRGDTQGLMVDAVAFVETLV